MQNSPLIRAFIRANTPVLLWGPPGVGKSAYIAGIARDEQAHLEVVIGSQVDPADIGGYLVPDKAGIVQVSPPPWVRRIKAALDKKQAAWLFLDEISCAPPSVQAAMLRVVQERVAAGVDLTGCRIIGAANPADTAADGGILAAASANRWAHIQVGVDVAAWVAGETSGWGSPRTAQHAAASAAVAGWIHKNPAALLVAPTGNSATTAWPSPRAWSAAARVLSALPQGGRDAMAVHAVAACVGATAAAEWSHWMAENDLPDPEALLRGEVAFPARGDVAMAASLAMVAAAMSEHEFREQRLNIAATRVSEMRQDVAIPAARALLEAFDGVPPDQLRSLAHTIMRLRDNLR